MPLYTREQRDKIVYHILEVQRYLRAYNNWKYPEPSTKIYNCYYHEGKHERKFNRCYHARMVAKHMVKFYLLVKELK